MLASLAPRSSPARLRQPCSNLSTLAACCLLHSKRPPAPGRLFLGSSEVTLGPRSADSRELESSALPGTPLETSPQFFPSCSRPSISFLSSRRLAGAAELLGKDSFRGAAGSKVFSTSTWRPPALCSTPTELHSPKAHRVPPPPPTPPPREQ